MSVTTGDRHGVPPRTSAALVPKVEHRETHFIWPMMVLSVIIIYLKTKLSFMICSFENMDVLYGNSQKKSGGDLSDPS